jgi:hypothetical protein
MMSVDTSLTDMVYEVLVRTWRPLTVRDLLGGIRELYAATPDAESLAHALDADSQFTHDDIGRYGLDEFRWRTPGDFAYVDPTYI